MCIIFWKLWCLSYFKNDAAAAYGFTGDGNPEVCYYPITTTAPPTTTQMATTNVANGGGNSNNNGGNSPPGGNRKKRNANDRGPPSAQQQADLAENLLRVDVYFETLSVQNITETPTYDVSKLTYAI